MSVALSSGVSGLQAHQQMLDVAGNNLANVNTTAYKSTKVNFSELFSQTLVNASSPSSTVGGTNPQQMGNGVGVSSVNRNITQGNIVKTGNPLDVAIDGQGFLVASDGEKEVYTRAGTLAVDQNATLTDVSTGYRIQRTTSTGEADGFQSAGDSTIYIPYDKPMEPNATTEVSMAGNLSANLSFETAQTHAITSNTVFTTNSAEAASTTELADLDQLSYATSTQTWGTASVAITGFTHAGTALSTTASIAQTDNLGEMATKLETAINTAITAAGESTSVGVTVSDGQLVVTNSTSGYSELDLNMAWTTGTGNSTIEMPGYFEVMTVGGEEVKDVSITVFDGSGVPHILTGAFVRTDTANTWDFLLKSITGTIHEITNANRRINGLAFDTNNGSYAGLPTGTDNSVTISFGDGTSSAQEISLDFGTIGKFNGLSQVGGPSTAVATEQDGYEKGDLSSLAINPEGTLIGTFTNGIKRDIATLKMAIFRNPVGLESIGKGYYSPTVNSGTAVGTRALTGGAGKMQGSALEKSNADVASEFVTLIQAQNGYQANARTIRVANDILRELIGLIR
jgi:flagellar hook protein FlgE